MGESLTDLGTFSYLNTGTAKDGFILSCAQTDEEMRPNKKEKTENALKLEPSQFNPKPE